MLNKIYAVIAAAVVTTYGIVGVTGWEFGNPERRVVPADARRSPGWARSGSTHIWYSGYRGGK
jgi:hypothetical protein